MKTLKSLTAALLVVLSASAFATDNISNNKLQADYAVNTYINAVSNGNLEGLAEVLDNGVKFTSARGTEIISHNKSEVLNSLKANTNVKQNCETDYSMVEVNPSMAVVKVSMKYAEFTKISFVTMANTSGGWKITNVSSSFN